MSSSSYYHNSRRFIYDKITHLKNVLFEIKTNFLATLQTKKMVQMVLHQWRNFLTEAKIKKSFDDEKETRPTIDKM